MGLIQASEVARSEQVPGGTGKAVLPSKVMRTVFLGDSITYSGLSVSLVEAYFVSRQPGRVFEFINVGLPSETVSGLSEEGHAGGQFPRPDLHERLQRVLTAIKPDLVFACYGMNDGIYLPLEEGRFKKFREGMDWLHQQVVKTGAEIVHITPPTFDEVKGGHPGYSAVLGKYSDWLLSQRTAAGWNVVDLHRPMDAYLMERRKQDPQFFLAADGVHANDLGHWIIAKQILLHLGARDIANVTDSKTLLAGCPSGEQLFTLIQQRQNLMKDAWLTATGHKRPGMNKGLPLAEAQEQAAELEKRIRELAGDCK